MGLGGHLLVEKLVCVCGGGVTKQEKRGRERGEVTKQGDLYGSPVGEAQLCRDFIVKSLKEIAGQFEIKNMYIRNIG